LEFEIRFSQPERVIESHGDTLRPLRLN